MIGPGLVGLLAVAVAAAKALGAVPVILAGTRENRLAIGCELGAEVTIDARSQDIVARIKELTGKGADYFVDCAGTAETINQAVHMTSRGGRICLAAFPKQPVEFDIGHLAVNNICLYGIRSDRRSAMHRAMALMTERRFDASKTHAHTFASEDLPTALRYARERVDDATNVVISMGGRADVATATAE